MSEAQTERTPLLAPDNVESTAVYPVIHMIKKVRGHGCVDLET